MGNCFNLPLLEKAWRILFRFIEEAIYTPESPSLLARGAFKVSLENLQSRAQQNTSDRVSLTNVMCSAWIKTLESRAESSSALSSDYCNSRQVAEVKEELKGGLLVSLPHIYSKLEVAMIPSPFLPE
ncbi:hypothetical protein TcWFU_007658 [Taenia crassiceps]|uniref:Uncharacterized protein n=1 Tax=Taenia crassiceps TaxID=6207 RepID=A0ABR4QSH6_9CEST